MTYKVIQWATGAVGREAIRHILAHPDLDLVGVYVYSKDKDGLDAGELVGCPPTGVLATRDRDELMALDADCVLHSAAMFGPQGPTLAENDKDVIALLQGGKNVVSVAGFLWPELRGTEVAAQLEAACAEGGSTLHGTGINPGFYLERVSPIVTSLCQRVDRLVLRENWDASNYPSTEMLFDVVGFGKPAEWLTLDAPPMVMLGEWFYETLRSFCDYMGLTVDGFDRNYEYGLATREIVLPTGVIPEGTLAAVGWTWSAIVNGEPRVSVNDRWIADWDIPGWGGTPAHSWQIEVDGVPSMRVRFEFDDTYPALPDAGSGPIDRITPATTAALAVNAIPQVCDAEPGLWRPPAFAPCRVGFGQTGGAA